MTLAPGIKELLELALTALINAPRVFARLEARPTPSPGASFLLALAWGALFFALNLMHAAVANPALLRAYAPWQIGAAAIFGLGAWTALYVLGSSFIYGLGRMLGRAGDFDRALLITALALTAAPALALSWWFPPAWAVPAVVASWMLACGLSALFKTDPWAARGVCAVLAAGVLALQYGAGMVVEKYSAAAQLAAVAAQAAPSANQIAELQRQLEEVRATAVDMSKVAPPQANESSLDLLRGPVGAEPHPTGMTPKQQLAQMSASGDAVNKSALAMLDSMGPLLSNPMITNSMTAPQKANFAELQKMISVLKTDLAANTITSPQEQQARMAKIQKLVMRMMSAGMTMPERKPSSAPERGNEFDGQGRSCHRLGAARGRVIASPSPPGHAHRRAP